MWDQLKDLAPLSHSREQVQTKTDKLKEIDEQRRLKIRPGKTKIFKINTTCLVSATIDGKDIEEVSCFTYLGS